MVLTLVSTLQFTCVFVHAKKMKIFAHSPHLLSRVRGEKLSLVLICFSFVRRVDSRSRGEYFKNATFCAVSTFSKFWKKKVYLPTQPTRLSSCFVVIFVLLVVVVFQFLRLRAVNHSLSRANERNKSSFFLFLFSFFIQNTALRCRNNKT